MPRFYHRVLRWCFYRNEYEASELSYSEEGSSQYSLSAISRRSQRLRGYYMLEVDCHNLATRLVESILHLDYGDGFEEQNSIPFVLRAGRVSKRLIYFKTPVRRLALTTNNSCEARILENIDFRFVKTTRLFANSRMRKKLISNGYNKSDVDPLDCAHLYEVYNDVLKVKHIPGNYENWIDFIEYKHWLPLPDYTKIKFSIVVPVFNSKSKWLKACIDSVLKQTYQHWQLILVDDCSTNKETLSVLKLVEESDPRIEVIYQKQNGHICVATNAGIKSCSGDYVLFLDHDDVLSSHAIKELACAIEHNPKLKLLYSDEDLISESGKRVHYHFKPDWNFELLMAHNYITHLCCYKRSLVEELGGLREGFEGAQDYDLVLRASSILAQEEISHIPKVLYHWRMVEGSTAENANAKSYATDAGLKALKDFFIRQKIKVNIHHAKQANFYKVNWPLPLSKPKVSIIIPTRDAMALLKACIDSIFATVGYSNFEIVVVDNGSVESQSLEYLAQIDQLENVQVVRYNIPFNYSRLNNLGVSHATGRVLLLMNNDVEAITHGWLEEMLSLACRSDTGCVGAKLHYPDRKIQHAGVILGLGGYAAHSHRGCESDSLGYMNRLSVRQNMSAVTAACLMIRREIYEGVGGMDENFSVAYNDVDFCLRVKAGGYHNIFTPYAELIHHESKTRGEDISKEQQRRFNSEKAALLERWQPIINNDPAYSPNLTRSREDFSIM